MDHDWEEIIQRLYAWALCVVGRIAPRADARDVVQGVVARVLASRGVDKPDQYFKTSIRNAALRERAASNPTAPMREEASPSPSPPDLLVRAERLRLVREAVSSLPPQQRRYMLAWLQGMTYSAIATQNGVTEGTVRGACSTARAVIRDRIGRIYGESES